MINNDPFYTIYRILRLSVILESFHLERDRFEALFLTPSLTDEKSI